MATKTKHENETKAEHDAKITDDTAPAAAATPDEGAIGVSDDGTEIEIGRTKISTLNVSLVAGAVVLILLLVFILENTRSVRITFFGADTTAPLAVALLLSAAIAALVVGLVALTRIAQIKRRYKKG